MANFQYKTASSGSWTDVPTTAYHGTLEGSFDVIYPEPQARTAMGRPCAAIGDPKINIESTIMTGSGMQFWQSKFASTSSLDVEFWLSAKDTRSNTWKKYTGYLLRPTYSRVQVGTGSLNTLYFDTKIALEFAVETT